MDNKANAQKEVFVLLEKQTQKKPGGYKYPKRNKVAYKIFNREKVSIFVGVTVFLQVLHSKGDWFMAGYIALASYLTVSFMDYIVFMNLTGHGVGMMQKSKIPILKLPLVAIQITGSMFIVFCLLLVSVFFERHLTPTEAQLFVSSIFYAFLSSFFVWTFHTFYDTWYEDVNTAANEIIRKNRGISRQKLNVKLQRLLEEGVLKKK